MKTIMHLHGGCTFYCAQRDDHTAAPHLLSIYPGLVDDWTLGNGRLGCLRGPTGAHRQWRFVYPPYSRGHAGPGDMLMVGEVVSANVGAAGCSSHVRAGFKYFFTDDHVSQHGG